MKKPIVLSAIVLAILMGATASFADYKDIADEVDTVFKFWVGGSARETDTTVIESFADQQSPPLPEADGRVGTAKAGEYYYGESSASGGFFLKTAKLPQRIHLELDYFNDKEWYGDFRYSYLDYVQIRVLPRRLYHNLDNITIYDFTPTDNTFSEIEINDQGIDDYGVRTDINNYKLRFKTPNFPFHLYGNGETVRRAGTRQARFLGGSAYYSDLLRTTESREVDQEKLEYTIGANAHLGMIEFDLSHKNRSFESDVDAPTYDYTGGTSVHGVTPELEATTDTLKIHTSHSGRIFAAATFSQLKSENTDSGAEAQNTLSYGEIFWLPASYLAMTAKFRHQENESSSPDTVTGIDWQGNTTTYIINPGVVSDTDTAIFSIRYSLIPKTNLNFQYTKKIKEVDDQSAQDWSTPPKTTKDEYELGLSNWVIPKVRTTAKITHTRVSTDLNPNSINNMPDQTNQVNLGMTWTITPKIMTYGNAYVAREDTDSNRLGGGITNANEAEALRQRYLLSIAFMPTDKLTVSPTYTYLSDEESRDIVWNAAVDSGYTNEQTAHNYALNLLYMPVEVLAVNCSVDYTTSDGNYYPSHPFIASTGSFNTVEVAQFSRVRTEEINVRLDTDLDLDHGWGIGLNLRYTDWRDDSIDNPADGEFLGGLLKLTKVM
ncbi:MAG: hypothetical protein R6W72_14035 [Desulfurivibrionaceae bacterium]